MYSNTFDYASCRGCGPSNLGHWLSNAPGLRRSSTCRRLHRGMAINYGRKPLSKFRPLSHYYCRSFPTCRPSFQYNSVSTNAFIPYRSFCILARVPWRCVASRSFSSRRFVLHRSPFHERWSRILVTIRPPQLASMMPTTGNAGADHGVTLTSTLTTTKIPLTLGWLLKCMTQHFIGWLLVLAHCW